ncbi:MAG: 4Fe-4S dicluster domain-containing protein [Gammaproteobacteria bacterium]|nr:MAG: 4Fe-4S dicluster domain-containing protein [Gammaproteobacteria bacterium]
MADGREVGTLVLVGVVGGSCWDTFQAAAESRQSPHPLDRWSRRVVTELAAELGAEALFPFGGPPYLPFLRWAQRAEAVHPSPIGPLIHPDYGLWHAYRGALAFAQSIDLPPADESRAGIVPDNPLHSRHPWRSDGRGRAKQAGIVPDNPLHSRHPWRSDARADQRPRPCDTCADKPCLATCPVGAFSDRGYDVPACIDHIGGERGSDCLGGGCLARRACPVGVTYQYAPAQMGFHMRAFLAANRDTGRKKQ